MSRPTTHIGSDLHIWLYRPSLKVYPYFVAIIELVHNLSDVWHIFNPVVWIVQGLTTETHPHAL